MRYIFTSLLTLIAIGFVAASAGAGGPGTPITEGSKSNSGPWEQDIFSKGKRPVTFYMRVTSTHDANQSGTLTELTAGNADNYKFKWFASKTDISHDVQTSGYEFSLPTGDKRKFKIKVKLRVNKPKFACLYANVQVDVPSTGDDGPYFALRRETACL